MKVTIAAGLVLGVLLGLAGAAHSGATFSSMFQGAPAGDVDCTGCVESADIATDTVAAVDIAAGAIATSEILDSTITTTDISATAAITGSQLAAAAGIVGGQITDGTVLTGDVGTDTLTAGNIAANACGASEIADGSITTTDISATADITGGQILNGTILNVDVGATAAIVLSKLASGTSAQVIVADGSGVPTYVGMSGDTTIATTGAMTIAANSVALATDTTGDYCATITAAAGLASTGAATGENIAHSLSTASGETDFLASGALTCGASTAGRMQVHTTALQYCDNAATPTLQYAAYGSSAGVATSATALAANPADCGANTFATAIAASGDLTCTQPAFSNLSGTIALGQTALTTRGDLLIATTATPVLGRLAIGAATTLLHGGTEPSYSAVANADHIADSIDFDSIVDTPALDATTTLAFAANDLNLNLSTTGDLNIQDAGTTFATFLDTGSLILGAGEAGTPVAFTLRGPAAAGLNIAGAATTFDASNGTGTGGSGALIWRTAPTAASSSTPNVLTERMRMTATGLLGIGGTAATTADRLFIKSGATNSTPLQIASASTTNTIFRVVQDTADQGILQLGGADGVVDFQVAADGGASYLNSANFGIGAGTTPTSLLTVGDASGEYLQIGCSNAGAPAAGDCDADAERGRFCLDTTNNNLNVCNGATRGWDTIALTN